MTLSVAIHLAKYFQQIFSFEFQYETQLVSALFERVKNYGFAM